MNNKKALTLIELLVVISIITFLLSILTPGLLKARTQGRKVVCKTNLYQWGTAFKNHKDDNDGQYLSAFGYTDPSGSGKLTSVIPNEFWLDIENYIGTTNYDHPGQFSHEAMAPYMPSGFNPKGYRTPDIMGMSYTDPRAKDMILTDVWTCPSFRARELELIQDSLARIQARGFMRGRYSYYGRSDLWTKPGVAIVTNPEDFGGNQPGSEHLLMADVLYRWIGEGLDYNHSITKKTQEEMLISGVEPGLAGINKMYGDGSAIWKDRRDFRGPDANPTLLDISKGTNVQVRSLGIANNWY